MTCTINAMCEINKKYNKAVDTLDNKNFTKAYTSFLSLAEQGDVSSQKAVAYMLINGLGVTKNKQQADERYLKTAELGDAEAQYRVAINDLENGNTERGLKFLHLSVDGRYPYAIYWLGCIYLNGLYLMEIDLLKAQEFFKIAIQKKVKEAPEKLVHAKIKELGKIRTVIYFLRNIKMFFPRPTSSQLSDECPIKISTP